MAGSLWQLIGYFAKLGITGFGGPIALVGYMERDLVEEKRWVSRDDYLRGLALAQLAPGPLATQLAMYIGYLSGGALGALAVTVAFVLPSFLLVVGISVAYVAYGGLPWVQALFYGIGASVIGIIVRSAYKLAKITLKGKKLLWTIYGVMAVTTAVTREEIAWLFVLCGVIALIVYAPPKRWRGMPVAIAGAMSWLGPAAGSPSLGTLCWQIVAFFAKAGAFIFGSGLAIVPFLYGGVVKQYQWLSEPQFLDAVAVGMVTPGPVVIAVAFIGYLVSGLLGATLATLAVFTPIYFFTVIPAPWFYKYSEHRGLNAFVDGVTSAASGAIAGACVILAQQAIKDIPTAIIAVATLLILVRWKVQEPLLIALAGLVGLLLK